MSTSAGNNEGEGVLISVNTWNPVCERYRSGQINDVSQIQMYVVVFANANKRTFFFKIFF